VKPGMYARLSIVTGQVKADVVVPHEAVQTSSDGSVQWSHVPRHNVTCTTAIGARLDCFVRDNYVRLHLTGDDGKPRIHAGFTVWSLFSNRIFTLNLRLSGLLRDSR